MTNIKATERVRVVDILQRYGKCLELVSLDPNFHDISVGLYEKDGVMTVWTFSRTPGVEESDTKHAMSVALERARSMAAADQLTEDDVVDAIDEGDRTFATAALAVRAGLAIAVVVSWSQKIGQLAKVYSAG